MRSDDVGLFQFYEPQNESSRPTEKGNSVRRFNSQDPPLALCGGLASAGSGIAWSSGSHLLQFFEESCVAHPTLNELLARS